MYFQGLILSLSLHLLVALFLFQLPDLDHKEKPTTKIVEIEYLRLKPNQIVAHAQATNLDLTNQSQTPLKSKENQRVEEEQIAKSSGATKNRSLQKISPQKKLNFVSAKEVESSSEKSSPQNSKNKQEQIVDQNKEENVYEQLFKEKGISSIQDRIFKDIKYGNFTALNTNRHQFYSFYERVNEQIRIRWIENIESHLDRLRMQNSSLVRSKKEWISELVVVLDQEGNITHSYINRNSGVVIWDQSARQAFLDSGPFKNPPKEMADPDGKIRLSYLFSLKLN